MFKIEKNIPIPEDVTRRGKFPFLEMEVGDSFVVPESEAGWRQFHQPRAGWTSIVHTLASRYGKRLGRRFTCRKLPDRSVRVWRVE